MRALCVTLSMCLLTCSIGPDAMGQDRGSALSADEERGFAEREASSAGLERFEAGDAVGAALTVLIIILIVALVWWLLHHGHYHRSYPVAGTP